MIGNIDNETREVLPRWRDYKVTSTLGELKSIKPSTNINFTTTNDNEILQKKSEWLKNRTIHFASDLVNTAFVENKFEYARDAAEFILKSGNEASGLIKDICSVIVTGEKNQDSRISIKNASDIPKEEWYHNIRQFKDRVMLDPYDAISWSELSRNYIILGNVQKSLSAMQIAINLSPNNRYILRSASSLFLHLEDLQQAQYILSKSQLLKSDPWLLAAEISVSSLIGRTSKNIKTARHIVGNSSYSQRSLTELASSLATLEFGAGNNKVAKKLYVQSLIDPNENTVAQAMWAERNHAIKTETNIGEYFDVPLNFEAKACTHRAAGEWKESIVEIEHWVADQPYAKEPIILGSYVAATGLRDFNKGVEIAKFGLISNPNDPLILNNLSFSLANLGKISEAEEYFSKISYNDLENDMKTVWNATRGLIFYRSGNIESGREMYKKAIDLADRDKNRINRAMASIYLAQEEIINCSENCVDFVVMANTFSKGIIETEVVKELERLNSMMR